MVCLTIIGVGSMGSALLKGLTSLLPSSQKEGDFVFQAVHPRPIEGPVLWSPDFTALPHDPDILIFSVKPQVLEKILLTYKPWIPKKCLVVSVAAGKSLSFFQSVLGESHPVIRAMPNLAVSIGKGLMGFVANSAVQETHRALFYRVFEPLGQLCDLKQEEEMGLFTVLAGSAPAFVYAFLEALEKAAQERGFSAVCASSLVAKMAEGAMSLLSQEATSFGALRTRITSPQGVTAAGLQTLWQGGLDTLVSQAVEKALQRNQELGGE